MEKNILFNSHNFRRHINDFGVFGATVGPGTNTKQTKTIITRGINRLTTIRSQVGTIEGVRGNDMLMSTTEKGRMYGVAQLKAAPTRAMALYFS
jgi:hypothetical protein